MALVRRVLALSRSAKSALEFHPNQQVIFGSTAGRPGLRFHSDKAACSSEDDAPIELVRNPYEKEKRKCLLCRTGVPLDYKNARLLQQFVSSFSGRVYDRHITGLCDHQQDKLVETIALSRKAGYMPIFVKDPKYTRDPKLFDPLKPLRPHSFA